MEPLGRARSRDRSTPSVAQARASNAVVAAQADVVAATFANADLAATRAALNTYYQKCLTTDEENRVLRAELEQHDVDSLKVTRCLEQQLDDAHMRYELYKCEATAIIQRLSESEESVRQHYETLLAERDRQLTAYADAAARLQSDLLQASRFVQQRQAHTMELKRLQEQLEEMAETHEKELTALRFETIDRKMRLVALERTMKEEFEALVDAESTRLLEAREAALLHHSKSLEQEKHNMAHDIEELMALTSLIDSERTAMRRTADVHQQAHREVLRQVAMRNRQGREQELKMQRLEAKVRALADTQQSAAQVLTAPYKARIAELESQLATAQTTVAQYRRELKQVRRLAKRVVSQRTDLERFFHTAVEDCRRYRVGLNSSATAAQTIMNGTRASTPSLTTTPGTATATTTRMRATPTAPAPSGLASSRAKLATPSTATAAETFYLTQPLHADNVRRRGQLNTSPAATDVLPPVRGPSPPPPQPQRTHGPPSVRVTESGLPSEGSHFEDLSWTDKEKVIKALFFYINSTYYASQDKEDADEDEEDINDVEEDETNEEARASVVAAPAAQRSVRV